MRDTGRWYRAGDGPGLRYAAPFSAGSFEYFAPHGRLVTGATRLNTVDSRWRDERFDGCDDGTWFDTSAFARPTGPRFGTIGRNTMRGPGVVNADLSLFRRFLITERLNIEFRAESFNLSNTPHFANPNGNANSSAFGRITSTQSAGDAIGRSREVRFGLRLGF